MAATKNAPAVIDNGVRITLTPIQSTGRTEMTRELNLTYTQKVDYYCVFVC
jgi:hypothetical protein